MLGRDVSYGGHDYMMGVGGMGCHEHDVILIRTLHLASNQISVLPENVFSGLTNLG